ncbi:MAG: 50S ribosomal protein L23 [Simkaniaceae bacterium]
MSREKTAYDIIHSRYVTEKAAVLQELQNRESNPSVRKCKKPKYIFLVKQSANKTEIAKAVEEIYAERKIKVAQVNIINIKPKRKRVRGKMGKTVARKKAIVTLEPGDAIEEAL